MLTVFLRLLKGVLILALAMGVYALWRNVRPRPPILNYQQMYRELEERGMSAEEKASTENGYVPLMDAYSLFLEIATRFEKTAKTSSELGDGHRFLDFSNWKCLGNEPTEGEISRDVHDEALRAMEDAGVLSKAVQASQARRFTVPFSRKSHMMNMDSLGPSRSLVLLLLYAAEDAYRRDESRAADEYFGAACSLARHCLDKPDMVNVLVGISHVAAIGSFAQNIAVTPEVEPEDLALIAGHLERLSPIPSFEAAAEGEQLRMHEAFQMLLEGVPPRSPDVTAPPVWIARIVQDRETIERQIIRLHEALLRAIRASRAERDARVAELKDEVTRTYEPLAIAYESWPKYLKSHDSIRSNLAIRRLAVALQRHRRETERYPFSLDMLVPTWIDSVPEDPLALDGRFIYRPHDDGSAFVLYSVGRDGIDDGGNPPPDDRLDEYAFREEGAGYDFVVRSVPKPE